PPAPPLPVSPGATSPPFGSSGSPAVIPVPPGCTTATPLTVWAHAVDVAPSAVNPTVRIRLAVTPRPATLTTLRDWRSRAPLLRRAIGLPPCVQRILPVADNVVPQPEAGRQTHEFKGS